MLQSVFKYAFEVEDHFDLSMPKDADILSVQVQGEQPCIWALVEPGAAIEHRHFRLVGTGHPISENIDTLEFIGTFQLRGGILVFHLFEVV